VFASLILGVFVETGELQTPDISDPESCLLYPLKRNFLGPSHSERCIEWITQDLLKNLDDTPMLPQYTLASLDITNVYSNIPIKETRTILANIMTQNTIDPHKKQELLKWYDVITMQNYFAHKGKTVIQQDGLAMGAPSSGLIAEIFLQHIEHSHLARLTHKHKLLQICR